jgi:serine/threonine protein kinase/tetratricopeptide (TPR) repeat protein
MKTVTTVCGTCGAKIPDDATGQVCPACLLEIGLSLLPDEPVADPLAKDFGAGDLSAVAAYSAEAAAKTGSAKADGGVRAADRKKATRVLGDLGDYELLEEIGRGGQGVVYRAHQKSLNRTVALKLLGLGPWTTETHLKRFRREAEAAASLQHPGIVPIYEVGERDGQCYFSMKFVEGGQLDEVIKGQPIPIRRGVELIVKLARTVHYAHEHGILHRDIKPGNILLDENGEPHLTDFGLARLVEAESTVTRTLDVLGTPSYMAPEQAAGETTKLCKATDVYGLGAVLYQLLTGQPPFAGGTTYETIRLLRDTEPRQPRLLNPKVDRDLSTICLKCLEKDPQRRYPAAAGLAEDLEHWLKHEPIQAKPSGVFTRARKWVRRNPAIAALIAALTALAAAAGWIVWKSESEFVPHPVPNGVAVLPFENLSRDPDNAYFAEGMHEEILTRLASIAGLKVISRTSTQQFQSKPKNLREIARQLGVANILEGSVQKAADQVRVNVQLINAQTDSHLWAETYDRKLTDIFGVESEIAKGIAESLQAKLTGREEEVLAVKPTNNPEAYDAYLRGLAFEARGLFDAALLLKATGFYERAVELDPNFATAWARLSRAHGFIWDNSIERTAARRDGAKRALDNVQKLQPNSSETLLASGYYQYRVLRDYGTAKTTFERVRKILPGSSEVSLAIGLIARNQGNWDESIAYFEQALSLDPRNVVLLNRTAGTYAMLRRFPAALKLLERALDIVPNDPDLMAFKASIYQAEGNLGEAAKALSEVNAETSSGAAFSTKINQLRLERDFGEAARLLQARLKVHSDPVPLTQLFLAMMQGFNGDTAGAKVTAAQARRTHELRYKDQKDNAPLTGNLSFIDAVLGNKELALKEAERAIMLSPNSEDPVDAPGLEENLALIQTMFGENSRAISTLAHLLQTPYSSWLYGPTAITSAHLRLDPLWDPLRGDPAFQKLCEEKQLPATP